MALVTSFSLEELKYLAGLSEFPDASEHIGDCQQLGWQRWDYGSEPSLWCSDAGYPGCRDLWVHESPHGMLYWRHGEAILGIPADVELDTTHPDRPPERQAFAWLRAIHAHEQVLVP